MSIKRVSVVLAGTLATALFSMPAQAQTVSSEAECAALDGTVIPILEVNHCLVPILTPKNLQDDPEAKGWETCDADVITSENAGSFCKVNMEPGKQAAAPQVIERIVKVEDNEGEVVSEEIIESDGAN